MGGTGGAKGVVGGTIEGRAVAKGLLGTAVLWLVRYDGRQLACKAPDVDVLSHDIPPLGGVVASGLVK